MADDFYASPFGALYSAYMEQPRLSRLISRVVWGGDIKPYYESMSAVGEAADGATIVDCPCGAGPALRHLQGNGGVHYVAVDLSPSMLRRAEKRARARGLSDVEFIQADATDIPVPSNSADLFLSYWGLHCFDDPRGALAEAARTLRPGGRLVGSSLLCGTDSLRQRFLVRPGAGDFGRVATQSELEAWLHENGFELSSQRSAGPMWYFDARLSAGTP